jgi:crotonobetainyl-CoA:carnitine CoA-transferase CaiB-like acyl-CoA transferase
MSDLPLDGIRVCDLTWIIAGPVCTRVLADFGADVIRVEHEQSMDSVRMGRPIIGETPTGNNSGFFNYINRNKRSIALNVRHPDGHGVLRRLIAASDVLVENFSANVMDSWGLGYDELRSINPGIIYCSISGFGHSGRDKTHTTWGPTAQALSGLTYMSGLPGLPPAGWGYSYMDHTAGYYGASAVMMALHHRNRTGEGQWIDMSQVEAGIVLTGPAVLDAEVNGHSWRRDEALPPGNHAWQPRVAPHNTYRCTGDDRWIAIAATSDAEWRALAGVVGGAVLDAVFATNGGRLANQDRLDRLLSDWASTQDAYVLMERLQAAGVPAGVCQTAGDRFERDPQLAARDWWQRLDHPEIGECDYDGVLPKLSASPGRLWRSSPVFGADTEAVMREVLGMNDEEYIALLESGVFM